MPIDFFSLKEQLFDKCSFRITEPLSEIESQEYNACTFEVNNLKIIYRDAKITPTKIGQFVTLWKRIEGASIQPYDFDDIFDLVVINTQRYDQIGQFVFSKSVLIAKGIVSTIEKEGKRGFRVYPPWDETLSKQAKKTQLWQLNYFLEYGSDKSLDLNRVKELYIQE